MKKEIFKGSKKLTGPGRRFLRKRNILFQAITCAFLLFALLSSACVPGSPSAQEAPIEPVIAGLENSGDLFLRGRFSVVNPEMTVYALAASNFGTEILVSMDSRSVNMIDDQGRMKWEFFPEGLPRAAALTAEGRYAAVGSDQGKVYFLLNDGRVLWESKFEGEVERLAFNQDGEFLAVSLKKEQEGYLLYGLNNWGTVLWKKETGPLLELSCSPEGVLYYLEKGEEANSFVSLAEGDVLWEKEALLASVSGCGEFAVTYSGGKLHFFGLEEKASPRLITSYPLDAELSWLHVTENGERILAYSAFSGGGSNLFVFHKAGFILWEKRIPGGSLLAASRYGERIVASSWQEYSDDFSKVLVFDNNGNTLQKVELASRIEKLALSGYGNILALAGSEGNIFIMEVPLSEVMQGENRLTEDNEGDRDFYRPVTFEKASDETYIKLYFYDEHARNLVPVNRNIKKTQQALQVTVNELVKGPRRLSDLSRTIPKDARINVTLKDETAFVDLPEELNRLGGSTQVKGILSSLISTISQFPSVERVRFLVEGEESETFGAEGLAIDRFFYPPMASNSTMLYLPYRSGERYYLLPREAVELAGKPYSAVDMARILLQEGSHLFPEDLELINVEILAEAIILNWGPSIKNLFPEDGSTQEKALALLLLDSLLVTLGENFPPDRLVFLIEGEPWQPPSGYPSFILELKRPFYINPER